MVDGKAYGIPMRGTQPVLLFNNKKVLADAGVQPPEDLGRPARRGAEAQGKGVTPIALGGGDQWPTLMWFEYLYDRIAGPGLLEKALAGDKSVWDERRQQEGAEMLKQLVDAGAFGKQLRLGEVHRRRLAQPCSPRARPASS